MDISGITNAPDIGKLLSEWWKKTFGPKADPQVNTQVDPTKEQKDNSND